MSAVIVQKTILAEGLIADPGDSGFSRYAYPGRVNGIPTMRIPLNADGDAPVIARFGAVRDSLASLAQLKVGLVFFANYTSGPYRFHVYMDARKIADVLARSRFDRGSEGPRIGVFP